MAIDAKNAIEIINKGEFQLFSNEELISLSKILPAAGEEGAAAFGKLKDFISSNVLQPFADGNFQLNPRDMDFFAELIAIYGKDANGNLVRGRTSGKDINESFDIYKKFNDVNVSKEKLEENAQKLEQLEAKHNPHDGKEFEESRKVLDKLNITDDTKTDVLEAARLNAYTDSLIDGKLDENKYVENLKSSIELAVYSMLSGTVVSQANTKTDKSIDMAVKETWKQIVEKVDGTKGKVNVSGDAVMGYLATTMERADSVKDRIKTKIGNIPLLAKLNKRISQLDNKWSKKYGKTYDVSKTAVKVVSNVGIGMGMLMAAGALGPAGLAAYGAYASYHGLKPIVQSWKNSRKEYKSFGAFMMDNKLNTLTAVSGVLALGIATYNAGDAAVKALGGQVNSSTLSSLFGYATKARAAVAYSAVALKNAVDIKDAYNKGEGKKQAWLKAGATALAFAINYSVMSHMGSDGHDAPKKSGLTLPDGRDLNEAKVTAEGVSTEDTVQTQPQDTVQTTSPSQGEEGNQQEPDPCEEVENALQGRQQAQEPEIIEGDCDAKIAAQAQDHSLHTEFWDNRNRHFLGDDLTNALYGLFEGDKPVLKLEDFEGIDNKEEFVYKYAIMKANNIPEQRILVDMIEKACGGQLTAENYAEIARGMNSYDNHGNPLCWENTENVVVGRLPDDFERCDDIVQEPVQTEQEQVETQISEQEQDDVPDEEVETPVVPQTEQETEQVQETVPEVEQTNKYRGWIRENVTLDNVAPEKIKGYDYDFYDAPVPENEAAEGYDYDVDGNQAEQAPQTSSQEVCGVIEMANKGIVEYSFRDGAAQIYYEMPEDKYVDEIAAHLEGFDENPEKASRRYAAYDEVYVDLKKRLADGEIIRGAEEWMGVMDKHLASRGLFIDDTGYIAINKDIDRELLLEAYQADDDKVLTDKELRKLEKETAEARKEAGNENLARAAQKRNRSNSWDY